MKKPEHLAKLLRPDSSAVERPQDGSSFHPLEVKGRNSPLQAATWKNILLWQIPSPTVLSPCARPAWIKQLCSSPPPWWIHSLFWDRWLFSPLLKSSKQQQLCSWPTPPESHCAPSRALPISTPPVPSLGCPIVKWLLPLLPFWPTKCSGAVNQ